MLGPLTPDQDPVYVTTVKTANACPVSEKPPPFKNNSQDGSFFLSSVSTETGKTTPAAWAPLLKPKLLLLCIHRVL